MPKYLIYDPHEEIKKFFTLDHAIEKDPERLSGADSLVLVEDENLEQLLAKNNGKVRALFVKTRKGAQDFSLFKKMADFVLELPAEKEEVEALCAVLEGRFLSSEVDMSTILPPEIIQKYSDSINEKILEVEGIIKKIENQPTKELLVELRNSVHKFAGNAASYGYIAATPLCRGHEAFLESCYENIPKEKVIEMNRRFLRKFRLAMQRMDIKPLSAQKQASR